MAEKKQKSKEQQKRDIAKLAAAGAAAGYAASKIVKGKKRNKKAKFCAAIVGLIVMAFVCGMGFMYYMCMPPFEADGFGNGFFKYYYMSPDDFVASDGNLQVRYLDIGQGDCILIQLPDGKNMLIDAGKNNSETETKILDTLKELNIDTIDYGVLTHGDSDHSGGMDKVIASDAVTFKNVYMPLIKSKLDNDPVETLYAQAKTTYLSEISKQEPAGFEIPQITTKVYADFMQAVIDEECEVFFSFEGLKITNDANEYVFDFYLPGYEQYAEDLNTAFEKNNVSPIMILKFNGKKIMFTGDCDDAESFFLADVLQNNIDADVDVLKVAHHGGQDSTSADFLAVVKPEYSVISVGENTYDHPRKAVIDRLNAVDSKIFTTQDKGDIILTIKGDKMGWAFEKTNSSYGSASEYEGEDVAVAYLPGFAFARSFAA